MRIHCAHSQSWLLDSPPAPERLDHGSPGAHDSLHREQGWNIPEGYVRRHEHHPKRIAIRIVCNGLRGEHHGDIYIAGEVREPFGVTRVGEAREVKGVLVRGGCDDGVDFPAERESDGGLDGVACDAAGTDDAVTILVRVSTAQAPYADRYPALCRYVGNLVFSTHEGDVSFDWLPQYLCSDFGTNAARVPERHRKPGTAGPLRLLRSLRQVLIST